MDLLVCRTRCLSSVICLASASQFCKAEFALVHAYPR